MASGSETTPALSGLLVTWTRLSREDKRDALLVGAVGLVARLAVVAWAAGRIPAAADGVYYDKVATRIAEGHGYTWLWPDGVVTYAAHYPVGYPALVAAGYWLFGAKPVVAMLLNALLGAAAGVATWSLVTRMSAGRLAQAAGLVVALHPALVPYTPAIMTEGPTAALLVIAAAFAAARYRVATGIVLGVATLVRPQCLVFAPILGLLMGVFWRRILVAGQVLLVALAVCAPWTIRNCERMEKCALVSVNGGWNLAIGTQTDNGAWTPIVVPDECKEVFQEAAKDECFGAAARRAILAHPGRWLARMPAKLHATFDYFGAAPWYLHDANGSAFDDRAKTELAVFETAASRLLLIAALISMLHMPTRIPRRVMLTLVGVGVIASLTPQAWPAYVLLGLLCLTTAWWPARFVGPALLVPFSGAVILATAMTHAVFFGAGRYGLVVVPFVVALAFVRPKPLRKPPEDPILALVDAVQAIAGKGLKDSEREESPSSKERDAG